MLSPKIKYSIYVFTVYPKRIIIAVKYGIKSSFTLLINDIAIMNAYTTFKYYEMTLKLTIKD